MLRDDWQTDDFYTAQAADELATTVNNLADAVATGGQVIPHGGDADFPRPEAAGVVVWVGAAQPNHAINGDVWMDTSGAAPTITTTVLDSLNVGSPTSQMLIASGTTPMVWSLYSGELPDGLTLSSTGNLYGIPTTFSAGAYDFTLTAANGFGSDTTDYTGTVGGPIGPTITSTTLGSVVAGVPFSLTLGRFGSIPVTWAVQSGSLPAGLSLDADAGIVHGTASSLGSFSFTLRATNAAGYDDQAFSGSVAGEAPTITATSLGSLWRAFAVNQSVAATGSTPMTWTVTAGSLPAGLSLSSAGVVTGTPTTVGSYSATLHAVNDYGSSTHVFTGSVAESTPHIAQTTLTAMKVGVAFTQTLTATGGPTITWSVQSGLPPAGLTLDTVTGELTGTPTDSGSYSVTIRASNGTANHDVTFTGTVAAAAPTLLLTGAGSAGSGNGSSSISWSDAIPSDTKCAVAFVTIASAYSPTVTMSVGGVAMTRSPSAVPMAGVYGTLYLYGFYLLNPPTSTQTVTATVTSGTSICGNIEYYDGVTSAGSFVTTTGTGATASHTISSTTASTLYVQAFSYLDYSTPSTAHTFTGYNQTQRWLHPLSTHNWPTMCGDAPGNSGSLTFSATITANPWGSMILPVST